MNDDGYGKEGHNNNKLVRLCQGGRNRRILDMRLRLPKLEGGKTIALCMLIHFKRLRYKIISALSIQKPFYGHLSHKLFTSGSYGMTPMNLINKAVEPRHQAIYYYANYSFVVYRLHCHCVWLLLFYVSALSTELMSAN